MLTENLMTSSRRVTSCLYSRSVLIIKIVYDKLASNAPLDDIREAPAAPPVRGASAKMNGLPDAYHAVEEQKKGL